MESQQIKENFYFRTDLKESSEYARFMDELCRYKKTGGNKHDDACDGTTMLSEFSKNIGVGFLK